MKKDIDKELRKGNHVNADSNDKLIINFYDFNHTMHFFV